MNVHLTLQDYKKDDHVATDAGPRQLGPPWRSDVRRSARTE